MLTGNGTHDPSVQGTTLQSTESPRPGPLRLLFLPYPVLYNGGESALADSILHICPGCELYPGNCAGGNQPMFLSHIHVFLSLHIPSTLSKNSKMFFKNSGESHSR